jgi:hypothetical protein
MRLVIDWAWAARQHWLRLRLGDAELVARSVVQYAEHRAGTVLYAPPYHVLRAGPFDVETRIDESAGTLSVIRIARTRTH